jgi:2-aminoadipate transaminase
MAQVAPLSRLDSLLSTRGRDLPAPRIGDPAAGVDIVSFVFGFPDPGSLPASTIAESTVSAMQREGELALQYGRDRGVPQLADALRAKLKKDQSIDASRDEVMITAGGSQACQLVLDLLLDPGDTVLVEAPTWMGFLYMVNNLKGKAIGVPVDENGTDVDALEAQLKSLKQQGITPKLFYTIPNFQNPSGVSTTLERRKRIAELAKEYGIVVLEDDAYHDLRYSGEHLPPIYTLDDTGLVWYTGTFSKIVGAGMRLGWLVAPNEVITKISVLKTDGSTNVFGSHVAADWLPGHLDDHIEKLKGIYKTRRDIMLDSIAKHFPEGTTWTVPAGGFFLWVTLPEGVNMTDLRPQAKEIGVDYLPGSTCFADGTGKNTLRLAYSYVTDEKIDPAIKKLGDLIKDEMKETGLA